MPLDLVLAQTFKFKTLVESQQALLPVFSDFSAQIKRLGPPTSLYRGGVRREGGWGYSKVTLRSSCPLVKSRKWGEFLPNIIRLLSFRTPTGDGQMCGLNAHEK